MSLFLEYVRSILLFHVILEVFQAQVESVS